MAQFLIAAKVGEIPSGSAKRVELVGHKIALFNLGGRFYAIGDDCTHEGGPLSEGVVQGEEVECPWHGARFDIKSGKVTLDPANDDVPRYSVRVVGPNVEIEV